MIKEDQLALNVPAGEASSLDGLKRKAISGLVLLGLRKVFLRLVSFFGGVLLARLLVPSDFGVYAIVSFIVSFLTTFSGVGFGASLIQKREPPTASELRTIFTLQQAIVFLLVLGVLCAAPLLTAFYHLSDDYVWLIRAMSLSLILSSLKVIPSVLLQRRLDFNRFVVPEMVETLVFNVLAVGLAWRGLGVWSFVWAALARGLAGVVVLFMLSPWRVGWEVNRKAARELLSFGMPYEMTSWVGLVMNSITPLFLGVVYGATAVGYVNWARTMATIPTELIYMVTAVAFPTYSRLQDRPDKLRIAVEKSVMFLSGAILPIVFIAVAAWPQIVHFVFTDKWLPAVPIFYLFCINATTSGISTVLSQALYACGRAKTMLMLMVLWTISLWVTSVPLVLWLGPIGIAVADALVAVVTLPLPVYFVKRYIGNIAIRPNYLPPFLAALCAGCVTYVAATQFGDTPLGLGFAVCAGGATFLAMAYLIMGDQVLGEVRALIRKD